MAHNTNPTLQNQVIYSVYVRNHTDEGTFKALEADLERIKDLGTDYIWLMPIHPIGVEGKKGTLGCPYANRDYRTVNPAYGTMEEFLHLVDRIHALGMKCMIDVVYNHTSPDSELAAKHPEWFYHRADGSFCNKVGDWADVIDLDYSNRDLWNYQIESLCMWAKIVDGFRCDVASCIPLAFWLKAREEVAKVNPDCVWLAETIHVSFGNYVRSLGFVAEKDTVMYQAFDLEYEYDIREEYEEYLKGKRPLSAYASLLNYQEAIYPDNYNKMRFLENHDTKRFTEYVDDELRLYNFTAMLYFLKGTTLLYAGQEYVNTHTPSLFEKDLIDRNTGRDNSELLKKLAEIKKTALSADDFFTAAADDENDILICTRQNETAVKLGIFSLKGREASVSVDLPDGSYKNLVDDSEVTVADGKLLCTGKPIILSGVR